MPATDLDAYCAAHQDRFLSELVEFLRIPSISADPARDGDVARNAAHLAAGALAAGFTRAEVLTTDGKPAVYAERIVDPALPTALVYGHHDVQPVDPLDEWLSPPFEPEVRDGKLYGRGAVDDKGQVWMHLKAVEALLGVRGELPVNLKLLVEGEEEIGSPHFETLVIRERERLAADVLVVSDTAMFDRAVPSLCVGLRGLAVVEITVEGPAVDLHSGSFGGSVANPVEVVAHLIASLKDLRTGRVTVPGFYDAVIEPTAAERAGLTRLPLDETAYLGLAGGIPATVAEAGWSALESRWMRPTLELNGVWGGYSGPGSKTIIPARAGAKITCRLVPDQDPDDIAERVAAAIRRIAPPGVRVTVEAHGGGRPVLTSIEHPAVQAAARAMERVFGAAPILVREGGSIPPVETFARLFGIPAVLAGVGLPDDRIHAPNEKFDLDQYFRGVRFIGRLWDELAAIPAATWAATLPGTLGGPLPAVLPSIKTRL